VALLLAIKRLLILTLGAALEPADVAAAPPTPTSSTSPDCAPATSPTFASFADTGR